MKNIYLVPFGQDGRVPSRILVADTTQIMPTILEALNHKQIQRYLLNID